MTGIKRADQFVERDDDRLARRQVRRRPAIAAALRQRAEIG
jgi:hypothetical protein